MIKRTALSPSFQLIMAHFQIDLHTTRVITETETQGRFGNGQGLEFAETYMLSYWRPQLNKFVRYRDHTGNEVRW